MAVWPFCCLYVGEAPWKEEAAYTCTRPCSVHCPHVDVGFLFYSNLKVIAAVGLSDLLPQQVV